MSVGLCQTLNATRHHRFSFRRIGGAFCITGNLISFGYFSEGRLGQRFWVKMSPKSVAEHSWGTEMAQSVAQECGAFHVLLGFPQFPWRRFQEAV